MCHESRLCHVKYLTYRRSLWVCASKANSLCESIASVRSVQTILTFISLVCVSSCKADYRSVPSYCVEKYVGSDQLHKSVITNPVLIIQCSESTYPIKAYLNRFWKCRERSHCTRKDDASNEGRNNQGKRTHRYRSLSQCCHPKSQAILERRLYHSLRSTYSSKQFPQSTKFNLRSFKISYRVWIKCGGGSCQVQESKEILLISEG
jgi:hypothetical protein